MKVFHVKISPIHDLLLILLSLPILLAPVLAQVTTHITPDGSLGTTVIQNGSVHTIDGGTILGSNQFHSFDHFDVGTGDTASFTGPASVENILSRVTGGAQSLIDGTLRSEIPGANLYLLNPSGIMFGPNAQLDVMGSFHVSTADAVRLQDGGVFATNRAMENVLSVAEPVAFGFLSENPSPITFQGSGSNFAEVVFGFKGITVPAGETLSVIGGDIELANLQFPDLTIETRLQAPGGRVHIVGVGSAGEVVLDASGVEVDSFAEMGRIDIGEGSVISVSGDRGGTVVIRGERLAVGDGSLIFSNTFGNGSGAAIGIDIDVTEDLVISGALLLSSTGGTGDAGSVVLSAGRDASFVNTLIVTRSSTFLGRSGDIDLTADTLSLDQSMLDTSTASDRSGSVTIQAGDYDQVGSGISASMFAAGQAGNITINATRRAAIHGGGDSERGLRAASFSRLEGFPVPDGDGGSITLMAPDLTLDNVAIDTSATGTGQGGAISIQGGRFVAENGTFFTSSAFGSGRGGPISIETTESITFRGGSSTFNGGGSTVNGLEGDVGNAGDVSIRSSTVTLTGEGLISTGTSGVGQGGFISIEADRLTIDNGFGLNAIGTAGPGGNINIIATESVVISSDSSSRRSGIFTSTLGNGDAGNLSITSPVVLLTGASIGAGTSDTILRNNQGNAGDISIDTNVLTLRNGATIAGGTSGETADGAGGSIAIVARERVDIDGDFTGIFNGVEGSKGAGPLTIRTPRLVISGGGIIESNTFGAGSGGIIDIYVVDLSLQDGSGISSLATGSGSGGSVVISASGSISIQGTEGESSGILTASQSTGAAGPVRITTPLLSIVQGVISAGTIDAGAANDIVVETNELHMTNGALIDSSSQSTGSAGAVTIRGLDGGGTAAQVVSLTNSTLRTRATSDGTGGNININATDVTLNGATISATTSGIGNAGNITIADANTFLSNNSTVTTEALRADGGNIQVSAQAMIRLRDSEITATVGGGAQTVGGNITADSAFVILEGSRIIAEAFEGRGGNIQITAEAFLADADSAVSASAVLGVDGQVAIDVFNELSETVTPLPGNFEGAATLLRERCTGRRQEQRTGNFILAGRDRPPSSPGGVLPSPLSRVATPAMAGQQEVTYASHQERHGTRHPDIRRQWWYCDG